MKPVKTERLFGQPVLKWKKTELWSKVARINAEIQMVRPLLAIGEPLPLAKTNISTLDLSTLVCGEDAVILIMVNRNYLEKWSAAFSFMPAKDVLVETRIPSWIKPVSVFEVDKTGPKEIPFKIKEGKMYLEFDEVSLTRMVVISANQKTLKECQKLFVEKIAPILTKISKDELAVKKEAEAFMGEEPGKPVEEFLQDVEAVLRSRKGE